MMLHQDGSRRQWVPGQLWDLIVTMDDATNDTYSAFFAEEEGTMSSFWGLREVIARHGLSCSLYADRASHYWHTPEADGKVDKNNPTRVKRALDQLGVATGPAGFGEDGHDSHHYRDPDRQFRRVAEEPGLDQSAPTELVRH
jgi:hypothetical protein